VRIYFVTAMPSAVKAAGPAVSAGDAAPGFQVKVATPARAVECTPAASITPKTAFVVNRASIIAISLEDVCSRRKTRSFNARGIQEQVR
jgi:hypothetical protein